MNRTTIKKSLQNLLFASAFVGSVAVPASAGVLRNGDLLPAEQAQYHSRTGDIAAIALGVLISALEASGHRDVNVGGVRRDRGDGYGNDPYGRDDGYGNDPYGQDDGYGDDGYGNGNGNGRDQWGRGRREPQFACYAENARRQIFSAIDRDPRYAQDQSVRTCYRVSRRCRPLGCREIR